jgi:hypothetical protein
MVIAIVTLIVAFIALPRGLLAAGCPAPATGVRSNLPAMATTAVAPAVELGVDAGHVRVILDQLGECEAELPDELARFVHDVLDPEGQRTGLLHSPDEDTDGPSRS